MAQRIKLLVEAGKASAGPPLGPALGPSGINVGQVVAKINEKTKDFTGMKVPVEVIVDTSAKTFEIKTGSPPVSQLIMKEIGVEKLAANPKFEKVGNLAIEQVIKIANSKMDSLNCTAPKSAVKTIIGSCVSIGVIVEGMYPNEAIKAVNAGKFDSEIKENRTTVPEEKKKVIIQQLDEVKAALQKELEAMKAAEEAEKPAEAEAVVEAEGAVPAEGEAPKEGAKEVGKPAAGKPVAGKEAGKPAAGAPAKPEAKAPAKKEFFKK